MCNIGVCLRGIKPNGSIKTVLIMDADDPREIFSLPKPNVSKDFKQQKLNRAARRKSQRKVSL